jgi:hypothetical protein
VQPSYVPTTAICPRKSDHISDTAEDNVDVSGVLYEEVNTSLGDMTLKRSRRKSHHLLDPMNIRPTVWPSANLVFGVSYRIMFKVGTSKL